MRLGRLSLSPKRSTPHQVKVRSTRSFSAPKTYLDPFKTIRAQRPREERKETADTSFTSKDGILITIPEILAAIPAPKAKDGQIIIKVSVPETNDIWRIRVPEDITMKEFHARVTKKLGFNMFFVSDMKYWNSKSLVDTEERFAKWVQGRVREDRNCPIYAWRIA